MGEDGTDETENREIWCIKDMHHEEEGTTGGDVHIPASDDTSIHANENGREPTRARDRKKRERSWSGSLWLIAKSKMPNPWR